MVELNGGSNLRVSWTFQWPSTGTTGPAAFDGVVLGGSAHVQKCLRNLHGWRYRTTIYGLWPKSPLPSRIDRRSPLSPRLHRYSAVRKETTRSSTSTQVKCHIEFNPMLDPAFLAVSRTGGLLCGKVCRHRAQAIEGGTLCRIRRARFRQLAPGPANSPRLTVELDAMHSEDWG